jgi:trans-aconitate methyltransferase
MRPSRDSPWHDWLNAAVYQSFVEEFPIYGWLNRELASIAELEDAERVLDLACGTGATALGCLPHMHRDAELVGIDQSRPMVEIARAEVDDRRCRFLVGDVRRLRRHLEGRFDRAVCNAAFWQLPQPGHVLSELAEVLAPGARLAFSVPSEQLAAGDAAVHPFQVALARLLDESRHRGRGPAARFSSIDDLKHLLASRGFDVELVVETPYAGAQRELVHLMQIPAMTSSVAPGLSEETCRRAVSRAAERVDPEQEVIVPWTFVRAAFTTR